MLKILSMTTAGILVTSSFVNSLTTHIINNQVNETNIQNSVQSNTLSHLDSKNIYKNQDNNNNSLNAALPDQNFNHNYQVTSSGEMGNISFIGTQKNSLWYSESGSPYIQMPSSGNLFDPFAKTNKIEKIISANNKVFVLIRFVSYMHYSEYLVEFHVLNKNNESNKPNGISSNLPFIVKVLPFNETHNPSGEVEPLLIRNFYYDNISDSIYMDVTKDLGSPDFIDEIWTSNDYLNQYSYRKITSLTTYDDTTSGPINAIFAKGNALLISISLNHLTTEIQTWRLKNKTWILSSKSIPLNGIVNSISYSGHNWLLNLFNSKGIINSSKKQIYNQTLLSSDGITWKEGYASWENQYNDLMLDPNHINGNSYFLNYNNQTYLLTNSGIWQSLHEGNSFEPFWRFPLGQKHSFNKSFYINNNAMHIFYNDKFSSSHFWKIPFNSQSIPQFNNFWNEKQPIQQGTINSIHKYVLYYNQEQNITLKNNSKIQNYKFIDPSDPTTPQTIQPSQSVHLKFLNGVDPSPYIIKIQFNIQNRQLASNYPFGNRLTGEVYVYIWVQKTSYFSNFNNGINTLDFYNNGFDDTNKAQKYGLDIYLNFQTALELKNQIMPNSPNPNYSTSSVLNVLQNKNYMEQMPWSDLISNQDLNQQISNIENVISSSKSQNMLYGFLSSNDNSGILNFAGHNNYVNIHTNLATNIQDKANIDRKGVILHFDLSYQDVWNCLNWNPTSDSSWYNNIVLPQKGGDLNV